MALTGQFSIGAPCAGDNHFPVTLVVTPGADVGPFSMSKQEAKTAPSLDEREVFARLLLRFSVAQMAGSTAAQIKTAVEATLFNFTVTG